MDQNIKDLSIEDYRLVNHLIDLLNPDIKEKYLQDIEAIDKECILPFNEFVFECVLLLIADIKNGLSLQEIKNNFIKNSRKTKKRWSEKILTDIKLYLDHKAPLSKELKSYEYYHVKHLDQIFKVKSIEELLHIKAEEIAKWNKNKNTYLYEYEYFQYKTFKQKTKAIKNDIVLAAIEIINTTFNGSLEGYVTKRATILIDNPIFSGKKSALAFYPLENEIVDTSNTYLFNDYYVTDEYILRTIIRNDTSCVDIQALGTLDEKDSQIIDLIYSKLDPRVFVSERSINIDISEIVKNIYPSNAGAYYKDAEKRIYKIANYSIQGRIKEGDEIKDTTFLINFFDSAYILTDKLTQKRYAKIIFGSLLYNSYIKNKTIKVASSQYKSLKNELSKLLFFSLQRDRLELAMSKKGNSLKKEYNYMIFRQRVRFKSSVKKNNLKLINEALTHLKTKKALIKNFNLKGDTFHITFFPLSDDEKIELGLIKEIPIGKNLCLTDFY